MQQINLRRQKGGQEQAGDLAAAAAGKEEPQRVQDQRQPGRDQEKV